MSVKHGPPGAPYCKATPVSTSLTVAWRWNDVTCIECCRAATAHPLEHHYAAERLAELDRAQAQPIWADADRQMQKSRSAYNDWVKSIGGPIAIPVDSVKVEYIGLGTNDITQRTVPISLLTRLSDFIASIPGNALDRKSNAIAMQLRREIADVVCPADKVRG